MMSTTHRNNDKKFTKYVACKVKPAISCNLEKNHF